MVLSTWGLRVALSRFSQKFLIVVAAVAITCCGLWYMQRSWSQADHESIKVSPENERKVWALLEEARNAPFERRMSILFEIRNVGRQSIPVLVRGLQHEDASVRAFSANVLQYCENQSVSPHLVATLNDPDSIVRRSALLALGRLNAVETVPAIILVLNDDDNFTRCQAAHVLGLLGQDGAVVPLVAILEKDPYAVARQTAANALGEIGSETAVKPLINSLDDENHLVRSASRIALTRITGAEFGPYKEAWMDWWNEKHPAEISQ